MYTDKTSSEFLYNIRAGSYIPPPTVRYYKDNLNLLILRSRLKDPPSPTHSVQFANHGPSILYLLNICYGNVKMGNILGNMFFNLFSLHTVLGGR